MLELVPERFRTKAVAEAVASPSAIVLSGAFAAGALAGGLPLLVIPIAAAAGWAARVALALPRRRAGEDIDPYGIQEPWRTFVKDALGAKARFDRTQQACAPGPMRDRLGDLGLQIGQGVQSCWKIAKHGDALQRALFNFDINQLQTELTHVNQDGQSVEPDSAAGQTLARTRQAVEAQLASYARIRSVSDDAHSRLRLMNAQLDEAVARAVELSVRQADLSELTPLTNSVESLVGDLENLRQALEETRPA